MLRTLYKQLFRLRRPRPRPVRKKLWQGRAFPALEPLAERIAPAVTAFFSPAGQTLSVFGDAQDNTIVVSRDDNQSPLRGDPPAGPGGRSSPLPRRMSRLISK